VRAAPWIALLLLPAACVRTPRDMQRDYAKTLAPASLQQVSAKALVQESRTWRVRVYADSDYRAQTPRWQTRVEEQLERANALTRSRFGVTLKVVATLPWSRSGGGANTLGQLLEELEALDEGEDVDLVLGYVSSLAIFSTAHHQLGYARTFGRHAVLRGMDNVEEHQALTKVLVNLPDDEREQLYRDRRLHKEVAVLLHEWAHTLGGLHESAYDYFMYSAYRPQHAAFSPDSERVLELGLEHHAKAQQDADEQRAWAKEMRALLDSTNPREWEQQSREETLAWTASVLEGKSASGADELTNPEREVLRKAIDQDRAGKRAEAIATLAPLVKRHPANDGVQDYACQLAVRESVVAEPAVAQCRLAAQLAKTSSSPYFALGRALIEIKDLPGAQDALVEARARLGKEAKTDLELWAYLATLFRQCSSVTWAEETAGHAELAQPAIEVREWAVRTRRWVGLPGGPGAPVPPEKEGDYVARFRLAQLELEEGKKARAESRIGALQQEFPTAPGPLTLRCEAELRAGRTAQARKLCEQGAAAYAESVHARYLLGVLVLGSGQWKKAAEYFERVVELDPTIEDAWAKLAASYRAGASTAALAQVKARFAQQFGRPLR
jgi:predicted Zn-dependent protease